MQHSDKKKRDYPMRGRNRIAVNLAWHPGAGWLHGSWRGLISRGVTSCAGMTAQHVLLAQTKIGFLTGGRGHSFQELFTEDKQSQREEAFARATVALLSCIMNQEQSQHGSGAFTLS